MIAGPYEFLADDPFVYGQHAPDGKKNSLPPSTPARTALAAHNLLRHDAGWLSAKAGGWLLRDAGNTPHGYSLMGKEPVSKVLETALGDVGLVLFPEGPAPWKGPTPEQEKAVLAAGKALRGRCVLVLGISPWGYVGERDFLPKARNVFSCILGGGEGVGFGFSVPEKTPEVLWLRPDSQGRAVNVLEILLQPEKGAHYAWREGKSFEAWLQFLDDDFPPDAAMLRIVGSPPRPAD